MADKKRPDGVTIIALWFFVLGGGAFFGSCTTAIPMGLVSVSDMPTGGRLLTQLVLGAGVTVALAIGVACAAVGWGLWNLAPWARLGALGIALFHLPFFPVGTAIGIGTLWFLGTHDEARAAFDAL